jgi:hypothetical protein
MFALKYLRAKWFAQLRPHGALANGLGGATEPAWNGYLLTVACPCGLGFETWVTPEEADRPTATNVAQKGPTAKTLRAWPSALEPTCRGGSHPRQTIQPSNVIHPWASRSSVKTKLKKSSCLAGFQKGHSEGSGAPSDPSGRPLEPYKSWAPSNGEEREASGRFAGCSSRSWERESRPSWGGRLLGHGQRACKRVARARRRYVPRTLLQRPRTIMRSMLCARGSTHGPGLDTSPWGCTGRASTCN